jgi:hypothetical protein
VVRQFALSKFFQQIHQIRNLRPLIQGSKVNLRRNKSEPRMAEMGLGRVKTPTFNLRIEISSRLRQFEKQHRWRSPSGEDTRENNSARSSRSHVFTA